MFTDKYIIPGFQLVQQHQRILLHTLAFLVIASIGIVLGTLVSVIPLVAGFTIAGLSVQGLTTAQALNFLSSDLFVLAGASVTFVLAVLNLFAWTSLYLGGVIQEVMNPKSQLIPAVKTSFASIRQTLKPLLLLAFASALLSGAGIGGGWAVWSATNISLAGSFLVFIGICATCIFLMLTSLTPIVSNMDRRATLDSVMRSAHAVNNDPFNYLGLLSTVVLVNALVLVFPFFGVLITLITVPVSISALIGYYYLNAPKDEKKQEPKPAGPATENPDAHAKPPAHAHTKTEAPAAQNAAPSPQAEARPPVAAVSPPAHQAQNVPGTTLAKSETDEERTKRVLSKILKDL